MPSASSYSVRLILNTALSLTGLGLIVRASGAVKEIFFASAFGVSVDTDAFVLALTYATFLPNILGAALGTALIASMADTGDRARGPALKSLIQWIVSASLLCALAIYTLARPTLSALFTVEDAVLSRAVTYAHILAPLGATMLLCSAMSAVLNSAKQFYVAGLSALGTPLTLLLAIVLVADRWGVAAAAWGTVLGGGIELIVLATRIFSQRHIFVAKYGADSKGPDLWFWSSVGFLCLASLVAALGPVVDQMFLSRLETGAISNFSYASKVNSLLIGIFGTAFSVAIYPYLSDLAAQRDVSGLQRLTLRLSAVVVPLTVVATLLVYFFSFDLVNLLFFRGNFTEAAAVQVSAIQEVFAFQLPLYVAGLMAMRVLNALGASRPVLYISVIGLALITVFDLLFYKSMGAPGIALSAVLTSLVSLVTTLVFIKLAFAHERR